MKEISFFDVIGPNMIGPSSSHTAGALRIALMARKILGEEPVYAKFTLYGSFARTYRGHGTDRALLAGLMGFNTDDERIRDSFEIADKNGIKYEFVPFQGKTSYHPNTVLIETESASGHKTSVLGVSTGGGAVRIDMINGTEIFFTGEYHTVIVSQKDRPGVVAHIAEDLSKNSINIVFMRVYREAKGENAFTVIETDEDIDKKTIDGIKSYPYIKAVSLIEI